MKSFTSFLFLILLTGVCTAQYYYKDLLVTRQTTAQWKLYQVNKVKTVTLNSFEGDGQPSEGFSGDQQVASDYSGITTHTHAPGSPESWLIASYAAAGRPVTTLDTSDTYQSSSDYDYDGEGKLTGITNTSLETDNKRKDIEQHLWSYSQGKPSGMLKIKNGSDTTFVHFVADEKGNIAEEHATHNGIDLPTVYYYYDIKGQLTDIVRFNVKANRLLPDYVFEYDAGGRLQSTLIVQEGGVGYQKWVYDYDDTGLKSRESCFNKKKQLLGRVEYRYSYR
jgi:YD repeat-containing protein